MKKLLCLSVMLLTAACATQEKYEAKLATYQGVPESTLVTQWGVPDNSYDTVTARYLVYLKDGIKDSTNSGYCETTFTVMNGTVTNWSIKGPACVSD